MAVASFGPSVKVAALAMQLDYMWDIGPRSSDLGPDVYHFPQNCGVEGPSSLLTNDPSSLLMSDYRMTRAN